MTIGDLKNESKWKETPKEFIKSFSVDKKEFRNTKDKDDDDDPITDCSKREDPDGWKNSFIGNRIQEILNSSDGMYRK